MIPIPNCFIVNRKEIYEFSLLIMTSEICLLLWHSSTLTFYGVTVANAIARDVKFVPIHFEIHSLSSTCDSIWIQMAWKLIIYKINSMRSFCDNTLMALTPQPDKCSQSISSLAIYLVLNKCYSVPANIPTSHFAAAHRAIKPVNGKPYHR